MTSVPPSAPRASVPPYSTAIPDEDALKSVFLAEHVALTAEAKLALGDDAVALAPKVVEGAFVRAWDKRATLATAEQLHKFLIDDVHHAAARALSRRVAAHRLGGPTSHDTKHHAARDIDPQEAWQHIQHALHGEEHSPGTLSAVAAASRHEAAGHISGIGKSRGMVWALAFAIIAIVVVVGGMRALNVLAQKGAVTSAVNASDVRPVTTPAGQAGNVSLADGSTVHLAPESRILIPKDFGPNLRGVKIEGAGTFDIAPGLLHEFELHARNVIITAKGTSFTVSDYASDSVVTVVVGEGSVEVKQDKETQLVSAGNSLVAKAGSPLRAATTDERDAAAGWKTGTLVVNDKKLGEVLRVMKRWYGYDISVPQVSLLDRKVSIRVSLDSAMQAIHAIEKSSGLVFGYVGQNMAFLDPAAAKKPKGK